MSNQKISKGIHSITSSPELAGGPLPSASPDGPMTDPCGPAHLPANHSPQPESAEDTTTTGTSPRRGLISSASAALQSSLESRLQARLPTVNTTGSMTYKMRWKRKTTPRGRSYYQLVASAPRTSDSDCGLLHSGWPTALARDWKHSPGMATSATNPDGSARDRTDQLPSKALLAGWPTPRSADAEKNVRTLEGALREIQRKGSPQDAAQAAAIAGWPTPVANDDNKTPEAHMAMKKRMGERDGTGANRTTITSLQVMAKFTGPARITASGQILTGSCAGMESGGQLNPRFSGWLMGYPKEWCEAALSAAQHIRSQKKRKRG